jgi:hypothetical protein
MRIKTTYLAVLAALSVMSEGSMAATVLNLTQVAAGREASGAPIPVTSGATLSPDQRSIIISGSLFFVDDSFNGLDPDSALVKAWSSGSVIIHESTSGKQYKIPFVAKTNADADVFNYFLGGGSPRITNGKLSPQMGEALKGAGFLAVADTYSLPPGNYRVVGVSASFGSTESTHNLQGAASFVVPADRGNALVELKDNAGAVVPTTLVTDKYGILRLSGYPALRGGNFTLTGKGLDKFGFLSETANSISFDYTRPVVTVQASTPIAENFPGVKKSISITDPLTNKLLTGSLETMARMTTVSGTLNGVSVSSTETTVTLPEADSRYPLTPSVSTGTAGEIDLWLNRPDAPDVKISMTAWDPSVGVTVFPEKPVYAAGVENINIIPSRAPGSGCMSIATPPEPGSTSLAYDNPICAVKWTPILPGMAANPMYPTYLSGILTALGKTDIGYEIGVVYRDPATGVINFYKSSTGKTSVDLVEPEAPVFGFRGQDILKRPDGGKYTFLGPTITGRYTISAKYPGIGITTITDSGVEKSKVFSGQMDSDFIQTNGAVLGEVRKFTAKMWYKNAPERIYSQDYDFTVIPQNPTIVLARSTSVSTSDTVIRGALGRYGNGQITYDPSHDGQWSAQIFRLGTKNEMIPVGSPVTTFGQDGVFEANLGLLPPGVAQIVAVATLQTAPNSTLKSVSASIVVNNGSPIEATMSVRPVTGAVPFFSNAGVTLKQYGRILDIDKISWLISRDNGSSFEPLMIGEAPAKGAGIRPEIVESGTYLLKANITNKHNADSIFETPAMQIQGFVTPKISITGPNVSFVGHPVKLTINSSNIDVAKTNLSWTVKRSATDSRPIVGTGSEINFTPDSANNMLIEVTAIEIGAPETDPARIKRASAYVKVLPPMLQKPMISGPKVVEVGKTYSFKQAVINPFGANSVTDLAIQGRWVLPDGTHANGETVNYEIKPGNNSIRYEAWVEGFDTTRVATDFQLIPWAYQWPEWRMLTRILDNKAPARVSLTTMLANLSDVSKLGGEKPRIEWVFPPNTTVISNLNGAVTLEIPNEGAYQVQAIVSDSRGNETTVTSDTIVVAPPPELAFNATLTNQDRFGRAPAVMTSKLTITGLAKNDAFASATYFVDGTEVGSSTALVTALNIEQPGDHQVKVVATSRNGQHSEVIVPVTLIEGDAPACTLTPSGNGKGYWMLSAKCTVQKGVIAKLEWKVDGIKNPATGNMLYLSGSNIPPNLNTITLTAITDKGTTGTATWTKPQ